MKYIEVFAKGSTFVIDKEKILIIKKHKRKCYINVLLENDYPGYFEITNREYNRLKKILCLFSFNDYNKEIYKGIRYE